MSFMDLCRERYSVRKFDPRPVEEEKLEQILEAGRIAPTACNYQPHEDVTERAPEGRNAEEAGL